jgi:hypothetical protein
MALIARSLHCSGAVRLQSNIPCSDEPVSTPVRDPDPTFLRAGAFTLERVLPKWRFAVLRARDAAYLSGSPALRRPS